MSDVHIRQPFDRLMEGLNLIRYDGGGFDEVDRIADGVRGAGQSVYFIGNGGSAAIASHMATDWMKNGRFRAQCFNDGALVTCLANDYGYERGFSTSINRFGRRGDLLFAISSSGASPNILKAAQAGTDIGMDVVTLSGFKPDNPLRSKGRINFYVPSERYGIVEIVHLAILHHLLDRLMGLE